MSNGAAGAAAVAAAIAQAIKASGAIINMEPDDFKVILSRATNPLVVVAEGGIIKKKYQYLTSYKGLIFFTKSSEPLHLDSKMEVIASKDIWIP